MQTIQKHPALTYAIFFVVRNLVRDALGSCKGMHVLSERPRIESFARIEECASTCRRFEACTGVSEVRCVHVRSGDSIHAHARRRFIACTCVSKVHRVHERVGNPVRGGARSRRVAKNVSSTTNSLPFCF